MSEFDNGGPVPPQVIGLEAHGHRAHVGLQGAALHALWHDGRRLVHRAPGRVPVPPFAGAALAPWPNRIAGGRYDFGGETHQLPVTEVATDTALHGLALWERWDVVACEPASVTLGYTILPRPGYPFTVEVRAKYTLTTDGLTVGLAARNAGPDAAPVGLSTHPYLTVGDGSRLDDWTLELPCERVVLTDERLLPREVVPVADAGLDFRVPVRLGDTSLDHAFGGVTFADGHAAATLTGPDGRGVRVGWDTRCDWVQVYTLHAPGDPMHRRAVALEPMTCAPDAFNSGAGLVVLDPGDSMSMAATIGAV
ncbi:aldose 1-epimerase family protein [Jatrophihabitans fulvus]